MKFLKTIFLFPLLLLVSSCDDPQHLKQTDDFNTLMGAKKSVWKFVETHEDFKNIHHFKELYNKNKELQFQKSSQLKIPQVIHFIWLGPNPFPRESVENVYSWVQHHPEWTFKFWSDRWRPLPHSKMELKFVSDFKFVSLQDCFQESDNYGEKSDILRYEILFQEGGLYVDHDVKCFKSFSPFHHNYDLYCGLEPPHQPVMSSSISICNNLIGVHSAHPVIETCIQQVKDNWEGLSRAYPGNDKESIIYRISHRTFSPFDESVKRAANQKGNQDIVFPAAYFNRIDDDFALYAHHYYASTWFEDETKFERNVRRRIISISRKNNQILLFNAVILSANLVFFACLIVHYRSLKKSKR